MKDFDEFMASVLTREYQDFLEVALDRADIPLEMSAAFSADEIEALMGYTANIATASALMLLGKYHVWVNS